MAAIDMSGQSLLVTGAARGVGRAISYLAALWGGRVTAVDINAAGLDALGEQALRQSLDVHTVVADVSTARGNLEAVRMAEQRFGVLNAFVANAAVIQFADALEMTEESWDSLHRVNLRGVALGVQAALPALRRAGGGSIILIASVLGIVGDPQLLAYGAAKGGLRSMCRSIAVGYAPENIRCNTICPGDIETDMLGAQLQREPDAHAARERTLAYYPMRRFASPEDIANAALFLASDLSRYITGTDLVIDGGLLAKCY